MLSEYFSHPNEPRTRGVRIIEAILYKNVSSVPLSNVDLGFVRFLFIEGSLFCIVFFSFWFIVFYYVKFISCFDSMHEVSYVFV